MSDLTIRGWFKSVASDLADGAFALIRMTKQRGLHINLRDNAGVELGTVGNPLPVSAAFTDPAEGTPGSAAPSSAIQIAGTDGTNLRVVSISAAGAVKVDGSAFTQPVSGTVTAQQATGTNLHAVLDAGTAVIGHVITDSGSTTAVAGNVTVVQSTGTNLHVVVDSVPANASTNVAQVAGTTTDTNSGLKSAGTLRVVLATDQPQLTNKLLVTPDSVALPANQSVNVAQFAGTNASTGTGASGVGIPRVTVANDSNILATQSGTWTVQPGNTANTTAWKVDGSAVTQPVSGTVTANQGTANTATNAWQAKLTDGTNVTAVKAASTAAAATDPSAVVQLSPNQPQLTTPLNFQGGKTNNNAAPGATNLGSLDGLANAAPPTWTEGNQVLLSADLAGNLRTYAHPPNVLGCYTVNGRTSLYAALAAAAPLFSMRWGDATRFAVILRVSVAVVTTATATTVGVHERELIIARSFSASDTGGTAVTLTGNNQKRRTSQGTSLVTDMRFGTPITPGTRTLDAAPIASALGWAPLGYTGIAFSGGSNPQAGTNVPAAGMGNGTYVDLLNAVNGQEYPIVLAQNEGILIRIGKDAQPAGATNQTYVSITWCEVTGF